MEIRLGARVVLSDGQAAGRVSKIVLEPGKGTVSHLVIDDGRAPGAGRLVPLERVASSDEEVVQLAIGRQTLERLPEFDPDDFVPLEYGDWPGPYPVWAQPIVAWGRPYPVEGLPLPPPEPLGELPYVAERRPGQPPGVVLLEPGMRVSSFEGQPIGYVERVLADSPTAKATYMVVAGGWEDAPNRLVPVSWVRQVRDREVVLVVGPRVVRELAPYPEA